MARNLRCLAENEDLCAAFVLFPVGLSLSLLDVPNLLFCPGHHFQRAFGMTLLLLWAYYALFSL